MACKKECRGNVCMVGCCSEAAVVLSTRATPTTVESVVACCGGLVTQLEMQNLRCGVCVCVCVRVCVCVCTSLETRGIWKWETSFY